MRIVVQKFGGTSVATPAAREQVVNRVLQAKADGLAPVVVVSAIGRKGDPYATDTLLGLLAEAGPEVPKRERDLLLSCGEIITCSVMAALLTKKGHPARALTGGQAGIITDESFGDARILEVRPEPILKVLEAGYIPVVAGFQGETHTGEVTTLGRGGSDTTAAALGAALGAEAVEIFTDVEGVMTADPRIVDEAHTLDVVTYQEITQMAYQGAKVIHPRAVEIAMQYNIPLRVRSTFSDASGTLVTRGVPYPGRLALGPERLITGIAHLPHVAQFKVKLPPDDKAREVELFQTLAAAGISIDLINVFPELKAFIVAEDDAPRAKAVLEAAGFAPEVTTGLAKVSVVGAGMRGVPGVMAKVVAALHAVGTEILQTADSHATISCLVRGEDTEKAICALHEAFELGK
ncbi:MAG: aspartate kinase [Bacillota bacterium]|nr:aspartate kinase [Bacillota bacterium]